MTDTGTAAAQALGRSVEDTAERAVGAVEGLNGVERVLARDSLVQVLNGLDSTYDLGYVDHDDQLSDDQVSVLLEGGDLWSDAHYDHWESENRAEGEHRALEDALEDLAADERELLERHGLVETVREEIVGRDVSDLEGDLLRRTPARMFRHPVGGHLVPSGSDAWDAEEMEEEAAAIADAAGVDLGENRDALVGMVQNAPDGGELNVLWYARPADLIPRGADEVKTVVFTDPHLLVHDRVMGSGDTAKVKGSVTVPWDPEEVALDHGRMSWSDDIAGVAYDYYETGFAVETGPREPEPADTASPDVA